MAAKQNEKGTKDRKNQNCTFNDISRVAIARPCSRVGSCNNDFFHRIDTTGDFHCIACNT
jgi:hypothetical protein